MKKLLLLVMASFFSFSLFGKCGNSGIWVFPNGDEIAKNSIIMIEGYARSQETIKSFKKRNKAYLKSEDHIVKLKVENIFIGEYGLTQAILRPEEELIVGKKYTLKIDSIGLINPMHKIGAYGKPVSWKVQDVFDNEKPFWSSGMRPKLTSKTYEEYGCGPAVYAHFQVKINDASETLVKTEVMDLKTNKSTIYYLSSQEGKINIGHGMCSGAFALRKNGKYKVRFDLMDASGNSFGRWSEWTTFGDFSTKMGMLNFLRINKLSLTVGVFLFFMAIFFKRHSQKV